MKKVFFSLFSLLFSVSHVFSMEPEESTIGYEFETTHIKYIQPKSVILPDHIKIYEKDDWYAEIDGNGTLEFVSHPIPLSKNTLESEKQQVMKNLHSLLSMPKMIVNQCALEKEDEEYGYIFEGKRVGGFIHKYSNGDSIDENPRFNVESTTFRVVPQLTFGGPLEDFPNFLLYMAYDHSKLTKSINRLKKLDEFPRVFINKSFSKGESLALFFKIYADLAQNEYVAKELGPKAVFTVMSRYPFSGQFRLLEEKEKEKFILNSNSYLKQCGEKRLFNKPYGLFYGEDLMSPSIDSMKKVNSLIDISSPLVDAVHNITVNKWFKSITNPENFVEQKNNNKNLFIKTLEALQDHQYAEVVEQSVIKAELENIKRGEFDVQATDLLSPPPFLRNSYSMGKYEAKKGNYLIEMRGYATKFSNVSFRLVTGTDIERWLKNEVFYACNNWDPLISLKGFLLGQIDSCLTVLQDKDKKDNEKIEILKNGQTFLKNVIYYSTYFQPVESAINANNINSIYTELKNLNLLLLEDK